MLLLRKHHDLPGHAVAAPRRFKFGLDQEVVSKVKGSIGQLPPHAKPMPRSPQCPPRHAKDINQSCTTTEALVSAAMAPAPKLSAEAPINTILLCMKPQILH
jgi:hypothetical protein